MTFPGTPDTQAATDYRDATKQCRGGVGAICLGLPPVSCSAFAGDSRLDLSNPNMCVDCTHSATAYVTFLVIVGVGALGALAIFARLSFRHPHARKRWISSALLLVTHAQALALLSYLHLAWPPAVQLLVDDVLSMNIFNVQAASASL